MVFKVTEENMSKGANLTWQGLHVFTNGGSFVFQFFDASGVKDPVEDTPVEPTEPDIDIGSGYTAAQIAQMRSEQEKTIRTPSSKSRPPKMPTRSCRRKWTAAKSLPTLTAR